MKLIPFYRIGLLLSLTLLCACNQKTPAPAAKIAGPASPGARAGTGATDGYAEYVNARFGFSLRYPDSLLKGQGEADNGDGQSFESKDGGARLAAWGSNNVLDKTIKSEFADALKDDKKSSRKVTLKIQKDNWFVISGLNGDNIFYRKQFLLKDQWVVFDFTYPAAQRAQWDPVVAAVAKSFNPAALPDVADRAPH